MFSTDVWFKVWGVNNKGNYAEVECTTSQKNKQTGSYETDFSSKFVRFVGNAFRKSPQAGERIKVTSCGVQNVYEKDGQRVYPKNPTFVVFDFERDEGATAPSGNNTNYMPDAYGSGSFEPVTLGTDEPLPF